jgi:uncharacterized protein
MAVNRRHFLMFLGASAGTLALQPIASKTTVSLPFLTAPADANVPGLGVPGEAVERL